MRKLKRIWKGTLCGAMLLSMVACGAKSADMGDNWYGGGSYYDENYRNSFDSIEVPKSEASSGWSSDAKLDGEGIYGNADTSLEQAGNTALYAENTRKAIKTATLRLQTTEFDMFISAFENYVASTGSYMQYANVYGSDYYSNRRSAEYTVRVPAQNLDSFLSGIDGMATVVNKTLGEEDVTLQYVDIESRLEALRVEQERLLALLEKAQDLESIILLEQRLSEVRYSIESATAKLRTYDDKITYSTVRINVSEVLRVNDPVPETVWQRISVGWSDTIYDIAMGTQDFLVWFVINLPYLAFWAAVIAGVVVFIKTKRKKRKLRKLMKDNEAKLDDKEQER